MKRKLSLYLLLFILCFSITGCGEKGTEGKQNENTDPTSSESLNTSKANIQETVIVDKNDIKITVKSISYDNWFGPEIELLIENNSSQDIAVQARDFSINGIMIEPVFSAEVAAGKKSNDGISISNNLLEIAKITTIKDIEFGLAVIDGNSWDDIFVENGIKLQTDATDYVQTYNTEGTLVIDQNDIKIYVLKLDDTDSFWGADIYVYIENNSSQDIIVQANDVSINGFMVDPVFSSDVTAGKKVYDSITFFESDLEDNNITDIQEIELKFDVSNGKTWKNIFETEIKKIEF